MAALTYLYRGFLPSGLARDIADMGDKYPVVIELNQFFPSGWSTDLFPERSYTVHSEGCMGEPQSETRPGIPYGIVQKDFFGPGTACFLFLPDEAARDRLVEIYPDFVADKEPFQTRIET